MTNNTKILIGVGALALALYLYKRKKDLTSYASADGNTSKTDIRITIDKCKAPCYQHWLTRKCKCPSHGINLGF
jgi:hypothetical protein